MIARQHQRIGLNSPRPVQQNPPLRRNRGERCSFVAYDFLDIDVYWNVRFFYESCGFTSLDPAAAEIDLLVVLRGDPGVSHRHRHFQGSVHIYDYVKEFSTDWRERFPAAREIVVISLSAPRNSRGIRHVTGYIPVLPSIWQVRPFRKRLQRPLHISNFKSMPRDIYQADLVELARHELIQVYGRKWDAVDIRTDGVSYWQANLLLASAYSCYGLMYPYQRGCTLSGRMWQAPLNGCFVISESGTNPFSCPGVVEVERFNADSLLRFGSILECWQLQKEATQYWRQKTRNLMNDLGLTGSLEINTRQRREWQRSMLRSHYRKKVDHGLQRLSDQLLPLPVRCRWTRTRHFFSRLHRRLLPQ